MTRNLLRLLLLLLGNFLLLLSLSLFLSKEIQVLVKHIVFTSIAPSGFLNDQINIDDLQKYKFRKDVDSVSSSTLINLINFDQSVSILDSVYAISMVIPFGYLSLDGCGVKSDNLYANIDWVRSKKGCCSDFTQTFMALSKISGINVREVINKKHTFVEFFNKKDQKWIFLDPRYRLVAKDETGQLLSSKEIYLAYANKKQFHFTFIGLYTDSSFSVKSQKQLLTYFYSKDAYSYLLYKKGNNIFEVDMWNKKLNFLTRQQRQLILWVLGIEPGYYFFSNDNNIFIYFKIGSFVVISIYFFINYLIWVKILKKISFS
jgi:hypothetical protein